MKLQEGNSPGNEMKGLVAIHRFSPVALAKAIKSETKLDGMRKDQLRYKNMFVIHLIVFLYVIFH